MPPRPRPSPTTPRRRISRNRPSRRRADNQTDIVVTGYRGSLQSSTNAKKNSTGFTDTIFAEDIGKFPDTNIAESFNRIPGVTISRETTGEGQEVAIRGLGTNFTRVLLNGAPVAIASTGRTDSQNTNREVDLDMFPTELFTQLTVNKSSTADEVEGGAAGTVNMRSARPFDHPGTHITYSGQATKSTNVDKWGYRGSALASFTSGDFGILAGVAGVHNNVRTTGYETIGLSNLNLTAAQCGAATGCNPTGGGNIAVPATVPRMPATASSPARRSTRPSCSRTIPARTSGSSTTGCCRASAGPRTNMAPRTASTRSPASNITATGCTPTSTACGATRRTTSSAST
ncbi:MAG: TonB-dependent receptor plug domain-containing protein [Sphingomonas sp.]